MKQKQGMDIDLEKIVQPESEKVPRDPYFNRIWDSIEYRSPVGKRYYLRFFFIVCFILFFIAFFFLFYTDFLSKILALEKIQQKNSRIVPIDRSPLFKNQNRGEILKKFEGLEIKNLCQSNYEVRRSSDQLWQIDFYSGHIQIHNLSEQNRQIHVKCPDIQVHIVEGRCDIFNYDNIIRITAIEGTMSYQFRGQDLPLQTGQPVYLLNRDQIVLNPKSGAKPVKIH